MSQFPRLSINKRTLRNKHGHITLARRVYRHEIRTHKNAMDGERKREGGLQYRQKTENAMKKVLSLATLASVIALPAFAQSFDPDLGTGNLVPPVANMGTAGAYAQAPAIYEREYVRHRRAYRSVTPRAIDRDNTSVPGQSVDKDDTTPRSR